MVVRADVHAVLDWYVVKGRRVILSMQNRYYAPDPAQPHIDFAGLTVLEYAGDGLFSREEDIYNPAHFGKLLADWQSAKDASSG